MHAFTRERIALAPAVTAPHRALRQLVLLCAFCVAVSATAQAAPQKPPAPSIQGPSAGSKKVKNARALSAANRTSLASSSVHHYQMHLATAIVDVVRIDLRNPRVSVVPVVAPHEKASFAQFIKHFQPVAAINGTFFDTRTWRITGNVVDRGRLLHEGYVGNAIAITRDHRPVMVRNSGHLGRHTDWKPFLCAMGGGPSLLRAGQVQLDPRSEGFHDPGLFCFARRSAVGYTRSGTLFLVSVRTPVTFHQLAAIMRQLGMYEALSLDGGSSTALYCAGKIVNAPNRPLTNLLAVYERPPSVARSPAGSKKPTARRVPACSKPAVGRTAAQVLASTALLMPRPTELRPAIRLTSEWSDRLRRAPRARRRATALA